MGFIGPIGFDSFRVRVLRVSGLGFVGFDSFRVKGCFEDVLGFRVWVSGFRFFELSFKPKRPRILCFKRVVLGS